MIYRIGGTLFCAVFLGLGTSCLWRAVFRPPSATTPDAELWGGRSFVVVRRVLGVKGLLAFMWTVGVCFVAAGLAGLIAGLRG
jgi:hypothetical protein